MKHTLDKARRVIPTPIKRMVNNGRWWLEAAPLCAPAYLRNLLRQRRYRVLSEAELKATRTSDTVFIFGSGYSINDITKKEWQKIAEHNTISLREFPRQNFVRADYHITGEVDFIDEYAAPLRENPLYADTTFVVQAGWRAYNGNNLVGRGLLRPGARVFRYYRIGRGQNVAPSRSFPRVVHGHNSIISATNFAILMGWQTIVLVGVDLYDKRYFWMPPNQTRSYEKPGITYENRFTNADNMIRMLGDWRNILEPEGIKLFVYNPRSLLIRVLPSYSF